MSLRHLNRLIIIFFIATTLIQGLSAYNKNLINKEKYANQEIEFWQNVIRNIEHKLSDRWINEHKKQYLKYPEINKMLLANRKRTKTHYNACIKAIKMWRNQSAKNWHKDAMNFGQKLKKRHENFSEDDEYFRMRLAHEKKIIELEKVLHASKGKKKQLLIGLISNRKEMQAIAIKRLKIRHKIENKQQEVNIIRKKYWALKRKAKK